MQGTLQLALEALMWPPLATGAGLRAAVGRLANALVAVLGPELVPGSKAYTQTKMIIREMQVAASFAPGSTPRKSSRTPVTGISSLDCRSFLTSSLSQRFTMTLLPRTCLGAQSWQAAVRMAPQLSWRGCCMPRC